MKRILMERTIEYADTERLTIKKVNDFSKSKARTTESGYIYFVSENKVPRKLKPAA